MKDLSRRQFLKLCAGSAAALGISQLYVPQIAQALGGAAAGNPPVIWIQGASCTGCSVSLLNTAHPSIKEVLLDIISLRYHPNVMAAAGELAIDAMHKTAEEFKGEFFLVVEGAVPTAADGKFCTVGETADGKAVTFADLVKDLGSKAKAILSVGTCSSYGGAPAAKPNPTGCISVKEHMPEATVINIPGCPPHPDWIVGTIAHVLLFGIPELDKDGRPTMFFGKVIHDNCPRRQYFDNGKFAKNFSDEGCLLEIGCKGPVTHSDCFSRQWNGGVNWCIKAGSPCFGCVEKDYPFEPFFQKLPNIDLPGINTSADTIGKIAGGATALGIGAHLTGNILSGRIGAKKADEAKDGE